MCYCQIRICILYKYAYIYTNIYMYMYTHVHTYMYMHLLYPAHAKSTLPLSIRRTISHSILHLQSTCLDTLELSKICQHQCLREPRRSYLWNPARFDRIWDSTKIERLEIQAPLHLRSIVRDRRIEVTYTKEVPGASLFSAKAAVLRDWSKFRHLSSQRVFSALEGNLLYIYLRARKACLENCVVANERSPLSVVIWAESP